MAQLTVIKGDTAIYKETEDKEILAIRGCDLSGLPDDFHALHWDGVKGEIEYIGNIKSNLSVESESEIESALGISVNTLIERRDSRITQMEKEARGE